MGQSQVLEAKVFHSPYGTGVAIVTGASRFTLATNIDDLKLRRLPEVPGEHPVILPLSFLPTSMWLSFFLVHNICLGIIVMVYGYTPGLQGVPSCWAVLTQDRQSKVLVANGADLFILDSSTCTAVVRHYYTQPNTHPH